MTQSNFDGSLLRTPDGNYENNTIINHEDALLPTLNVSGSAVTFRAGLYYQSEKLELGVSSIHLSEPVVDLGDISMLRRRNYFFNAGVNLEIGSSLTLHPSVFVRSNG